MDRKNEAGKPPRKEPKKERTVASPASSDGDTRVKKKRGAVLAKCRPSAILDAIAFWLSGFLFSGLFARIFTAYTREENAIRRAVEKRKKERRAHRQPLRINHHVANATERVFFAKALKDTRYVLLKSPCGYYSDAIVLYAVVSLLANFLYLFFASAPSLGAGFAVSTYAFEALMTYIRTSTCWVNVGLVLLFLVFPLPIRARSLHDVKMGSVIVSSFFERALGARGELTEELQNKNSDLQNGVYQSRALRIVLLLVGVAAGVLSAFVPPLRIFLALAVLLLGALVIRTPEAGIVLSVFAFPFLMLFGSYGSLGALSSEPETFGALLTAIGAPTVWLALVVLFTGFSYLLKVLRRKRLFCFTLLDAAVLLIAALCLFYGIYPKTTAGSLSEAVIAVVFMMLYVLTGNLLRTEAWISRVLLALQFAVFCLLTAGICVFYFGMPDLGWLSLRHLHGEIDNVASFFGGEEFLGAFLILMLPTSLAAVFSARSTWCKAFGAMCLPEILFVAFLIPSKTVFVFCLVGIVIFAFLCSARAIYATPIAALAACAAYQCIPNGTSIGTFLRRFFYDTFAGKIYLWDRFVGLGAKLPLLGVGFGELRYHEFVLLSKDFGTAGLWVRTLVGMGIPGLIVFAVSGFLFVQMFFEELQLSKGSHLRPAVAGGFAAILTTVLYGAVMPVFVDARITFLFWLVFGLACAYRRVSSERRNDRSTVGRDPMSPRNADTIVY